MLKVALTHDVDRVRKSYQYITKSIRYLKKHNFKKIYKELLSIPQRNRVYWNFPEIMEIEDSLNVRSTFFFLNETIPINIFHPLKWKLSLGRYYVNEKKIKQIIKTLDKNGWEIGLHGSYNSYYKSILLKEEKMLLEGIVGHNILGIRQHYLNLCDKTWNIQKEVGFKYDSSFGFTDAIGYKDDKIRPFRPFNDSFVVFPLSIMDSCYMEDKNREQHLIQLIEKTQSHNGVLVLNWHSNNFDEGDFHGYKTNYISVIKEFKTMGAEFKTLKEYWEEYNQEL